MYLTKSLFLLFVLSGLSFAQEEGESSEEKPAEKAAEKPAEKPPAPPQPIAKPASGAAWTPPTEPFCELVWPEVKCEKGQERVRKEWRARSAEYKKLYIQAAVFLQQRKGGEKPSIHDLLAKIHGDNSQAVPAQRIRKGGIIHSGPHFLPWHRYFIYTYECYLRKFNPTLTNSYWSWGLDAQAPELSEIWQDQYFGGNGMGDEACVLSGSFAKWQPMFPYPHCLKRNWSQGDSIGPLEALGVTNLKIASAGHYELLRRALEMVPHGSVHNNIGGDSLTMYSPNEPTFFLYHTNIDRLWHLWQQSFPERVCYNGVHFHNRKKADPSEVLHAFPVKITVGQVMKISDLCVKYEELTQADCKHPDLPPANVGQTVAASSSKRLLRRFFGPWSHGYTNLHRRDKEEKSKGGEGKAKNDKKDAAKGNEKSATNTPMITPNGKIATPPKVKAVDEKVKFRPADKNIMLAASDRSQIGLVRAVSCMPSDWIQINGLDEMEARQHETLNLNATASLNSIPGFFSPSTLYKRTDLLLALVKDPKIKQLCCNINGTNVCVEKSKNAETDPKQCLSNMLERMKRSVKGPIEKPLASVVATVMKVIGPPLSNNPKSAINPYARGVGEKGIVASDPKVKQLSKENPIKTLDKKLSAIPPKLVEKTIVVALIQNIRKDEVRMVHAEKTHNLALKKAEDKGIKIPHSATVKQTIEKREALMEKSCETPAVAKVLEKAELVKQAVMELKAAVQAAAVSKSDKARKEAEEVRKKLNDVVIGSVAIGQVTVNSKSAPALLKPTSTATKEVPKPEEKAAAKPEEKKEAPKEEKKEIPKEEKKEAPKEEKKEAPKEEEEEEEEEKKE